MSSPIGSSIGQVFIPVRDMAASVEWYSRLLGDVEDIGSVSFLQFADPDGNTLMVCRRN